MSFEATSNNRELAFITMLLSIFGAVEYDQMRKLFSHLPEAKYGKILNRLRLEGIAYYSHGAKYISTSSFAMGKTQVSESVRTFWAFIQMKDKVLDFCASTPPALLSFTSGSTDYDLIPVNDGNHQEIEESAKRTPEKTKRLLVVANYDEISDIKFREKNDYVLEVGDDGTTQVYKM